MFQEVARVNARSLGLPQLPIIAVSHPLGGITTEEVKIKAEKSLDEVLKITDLKNSTE